MFVLATVGNLYVVPGDHIVEALFAIDILLAALWFTARSTIMISVIAMALYIGTATIDHQPFLVGLFGAGGLLIVAYLAFELNRERERSHGTTMKLSRAIEQQKLTEERLRVGLSMADVTVTCQDRNLVYTAVYNARAELPADALLRNAGKDLLSPEDSALLVTIKQRVLETGVSERFDVRFTIDGVTRDYDMHIVPQRNDSGEIIGILGSSTEITARKQGEESRLFEATILQNIRDSVIATDLDGVVTFWNRGAERIFGYGSTEVLNFPLSVLSPDADPTRLATYRDRILSGEEYNGELLERSKDGRPVWVDLRISALRNAQHEPIGFLRVASDITDRKRLESEREESLKRETDALHQLQQFVALVAHDLDQPLTTISGVTQLLERSIDDRLNEAERSRLRSIRLATQRMSRLTGDLRQASAIRSGHFEVNPEPMDLMQAIRSVVNEQRQQSQSHEVMLNGPTKLIGNWDRDRVVQLMTNLVSNAIKYSPDGGVVQVDIVEEPHTVAIRVRDRGIGMTDEQMEHIFEPFSRVHDDVHISGTGLGLYISWGIVEAHGGRIGVESVPGEGSTFTVTIPRQSPLDGRS